MLSSTSNSRSSSCRAHERMVWLLRRMAEPMSGDYVVWDREIVDDFVKAFPEAERTLRVYAFGPNSSPMLNRAAQRAKKAGYVLAGSLGNEDAAAKQQRTWCRTWELTKGGREFVKSLLSTFLES